MINPFDRTFYKFALGFSIILIISFVILGYINTSKTPVANIDLTAAKDDSQIKK